MDCLQDRSLYPVSHVFLPFAIELIYRRTWLTVTIILCWELLEYAVFKSFGTYGIFPGAMETMCDVVLLDLGNGLIGVLLANCIMYHGYESAQPHPAWAGLALIFWSLFSVWDDSCENWIVPECAGLGVPALSVLLIVAAAGEPLIMSVGLAYVLVTLIPVSVPILVYVTSLLLFELVWIIPRVVGSPVRSLPPG